MSYRLPDGLADLRAWLRSQGATGFKSDRQAAFITQQILGTRFRFPPHGESCFLLLQQIQKALPTQGVVSTNATQKLRGKSGSGGKRGKSGTMRRQQFDTAVPRGLVIYADGCCHPNPGIGGWGFAVYSDCTEVYSEFGGELQATNQTMELTAALRALEWIIAQDFKMPSDLFSDSAYVVNGCNDWRHGWKAKGWRRKPNSPNGEVANLELWQALDAALTTVPMKLRWVKGHAGIVGNERADELSEIGRASVLPKTGRDLIAEQLAGAELLVLAD